MLKKFLLMTMFVLIANLVIADVPNEIRYNGKLKEYRAEVNATKSMNFKIYNQMMCWFVKQVSITGCEM